MTGQVLALFLREGSFLSKKQKPLLPSFRRLILTYLKCIIFWLEYTLDTSHCEHGTKQKTINLLGKGCYVEPNLCLNSGSEGVGGTQRTYYYQVRRGS